MTTRRLRWRHGAPPVAQLPRVGESLRILGRGPIGVPGPQALVQLAWSSSGPLESGRGEHFHVLRSTMPDALAQVPGTEPYLMTSYQDSTLRADPFALPLVHFYKVLAADSCEQVEE